MRKIFYKIGGVFVIGLMAVAGFAGNPDRQGEAGANELLINPWARSAGLHTLNTASIQGVEAMRLNIAGLSRMVKGEFAVSNCMLYRGTGLSMNELGFGTKMGKNGAFGVSLASMSFGKIPVTTVNQPEGTGENFSPNFFHIGFGYSYLYDNKISVGLLVRGISESISSVSAFGFAIDAGVQYVSGPQDNFRLGISLRNTGSPMIFGGQGLSVANSNTDPAGGTTYNLTYDQRAEDFELPSVLNIGVSYDTYFNVEKKDFIRILANFTSNAFSKDQLGIGAEFFFRERIILRGAYKVNYGKSSASIGDEIYTGLAGGISLIFPTRKDSSNAFGIDYAYRATNPFQGTHNLAVRFMF
ncbi:MAG: PorV/PorQ family protein [Saprospiraceae bacterium]|nr:PorV/PorQ family protein [Saprospiraceae bacterium]